MKFGNLTYLICFWIIPILIIFYIYAFKKRNKLLGLFANNKLLLNITKNLSVKRRKIKVLLMILSISFFIFALLQPQWGYHWEEVKRRGVDIFIALDVSNSMLAEDVKPNRLNWAKRKIKDLLNLIEGDRIGLIAFAGTSFVQCPLTLDYGAFSIFLDYLDTDLIPVQGTAIGDAITKAISSFSSTGKKSKALIIITDGEDHESDPLNVSKAAKAEGIKIFTIGVGKIEGSPIPERDGGGLKKDKDGNLILSKLDEKTLQKIALTTGGTYIRSVAGDLDIKELYLKGIKGEVEEMTLQSKKQKKWEERFQLFILLGFILLLIEFFTSERKKLKKVV